MRNVLAGLGLCLALGWVASAAAADGLAPGAMLDATTADQAKDLLPPEVYDHFKKGDYYNKVVDFPNSRYSWDDGFAEATEWNRQHLVLADHPSTRLPASAPSTSRVCPSRTSGPTIRTPATRRSGTWTTRTTPAATAIT